ncbi:MAG: universal stress protein [Bacteroidota bacterium]
MPAPTVRRILFPTDYSSCAEGAYSHAAYLADRFAAELYVLHASGSEAPSPLGIQDASPGLIQITLEDVYTDLGIPMPEPEPDYDLLELVELTELDVADGPADEVILETIRDEEIDLVVMGTHGRTGWRRGVLGSVTEAVTRRSPCPVLTVRPLDVEVANRTWPPSRVLLAVDVDLDPDPEAPLVPTPAMHWAARLAGAYRASLDIVYVARPEPVIGVKQAERERASATESLNRFAEILREESGIDLHTEVTVRPGLPVETLRTMASDTGAHLIVVGTHGWQGVKRAVLGSVAESLLRTAECPVLIVPNDLDIEIPSDGSAHSSVAA